MVFSGSCNRRQSLYHFDRKLISGLRQLLSCSVGESSEKRDIKK